MAISVQANAVFLDKVTTWQRKLSTVDVVLGTWSDLQKKWQALVSIFVGSADIRVQLPEDSLRFDGINADFKVSLLRMANVGKLGTQRSTVCAHYEQLQEDSMRFDGINADFKLSTLRMTY